MKTNFFFQSALLLAGAFSVLTFAQVWADGYVSMKIYLDDINAANKGKAAAEVKHANPYDFIKLNITADFTTFKDEDKNEALSDLATMFAYAGGGKVAPDANAQGEVMKYTHKLINALSNKDEFLKAVLAKRQALMDIANPTEKQKTLKTKLVTLWDKDGNGINDLAKTHLIRLNYLLDLKMINKTLKYPIEAQKILLDAGDNHKVIKAVWGNDEVNKLEEGIAKKQENEELYNKLIQHSGTTSHRIGQKGKNINQYSLSKNFQENLAKLGYEGSPDEKISDFKSDLIDALKNEDLVLDTPDLSFNSEEYQIIVKKLEEKFGKGNSANIEELFEPEKKLVPKEISQEDYDNLSDVEKKEGTWLILPPKD